MGFIEGLGRSYDVALAFVAQDAVAGAITGNRVHFKNYSGITVVLTMSGVSTEVPQCSFQQHTAASGGTSANLATIDHWYQRSATTLDGTQQWTQGTQAASYQVTSGLGAASQQLIACFELRSGSLSTGYEWVSVNVPDLGTNGNRWTAGVYILHSPEVQRDPTKLIAPNT